MKKNNLYIPLLLFWVFFNSCKGIDNLTQFALIYNGYLTFTPDMAKKTGVTLSSTPITLKYKSDLDFHGTRPRQVESIKMDRMNCHVDSPTGTTLDFLESAEVYIQADNLPEMFIAEIRLVPKGLKTLEFYVDNNPDLKAYLKKETFRLKLKCATNQISEILVIRIFPYFWVDSRRFGI